MYGSSVRNCFPAFFATERQAKIRVNGYAIVTYSSDDDVREVRKGAFQLRAYVAGEMGDKYVLEFPQEVAVIEAPDQPPLGRRVAVPKTLCEAA